MRHSELGAGISHKDILSLSFAWFSLRLRAFAVMCFPEDQTFRP
jgi:hypothetical protein